MFKQLARSAQLLEVSVYAFLRTPTTREIEPVYVCG